jgi:phosphoglycerate kinase
MQQVIRMTDLDLRGKRVLVREDFNVPVNDGVVTSDARIRAALPTLRAALAGGARLMILSHLGRPEEGVPAAEFSLAPVAARLSELLGRKVPLVTNWLDGVEVAPGEAVLCENVRFNQGEKFCRYSTFGMTKTDQLCNVVREISHTFKICRHT